MSGALFDIEAKIGFSGYWGIVGVVRVVVSRYWKGMLCGGCWFLGPGVVELRGHRHPRRCWVIEMVIDIP